MYPEDAAVPTDSTYCTHEFSIRFKTCRWYTTYLRTDILDGYLHVPVGILPLQETVQRLLDIDKEFAGLS